MTFVIPASMPVDAVLTVQCRVRHPRRDVTVEYWTINARRRKGRRTITLGDFGRFANSEAALAAVVTARLDLRTRRETAFQAFEHLVEAVYTPTLSDRVLAYAYDSAQVARGSRKRAYRRLPTPGALAAPVR